MSAIRGSMYADYIKEREGLEILEEDFGFITFKLIGPECMIANMFVKKEYRRSGKAREMVDSLAEIAKKGGCQFISGNIHLVDPGASTTLCCSMALGFKAVAANAGVITIVKNIGGE